MSSDEAMLQLAAYIVVIIIAVCTFLPLLFLFVVIFINIKVRVSSVPTSNTNPSIPPPSHRIVDEAVVSKLSLRRFNPRSIKNEACPICLEDFLKEEMLRCLPCFHAYHDTCITPWLYFRSSCCPLCKTDVRAPQPLRYRLGSMIQSCSTYAHAITTSLRKFGSSRNQSSVDSADQVSDSIDVLQLSALEETAGRPPGAYN